MPAANTENAAVQALALDGPPAASSATPSAQAPSAERLKPTVMPDVSAPESAGTVIA